MRDVRRRLDTAICTLACKDSQAGESDRRRRLTHAGDSWVGARHWAGRNSLKKFPASRWTRRPFGLRPPRCWARPSRTTHPSRSWPQPIGSAACVRAPAPLQSSPSSSTSSPRPATCRPSNSATWPTPRSPDGERIAAALPPACARTPPPSLPLTSPIPHPTPQPGPPPAAGLRRGHPARGPPPAPPPRPGALRPRGAAPAGGGLRRLRRAPPGARGALSAKKKSLKLKLKLKLSRLRASTHDSPDPHPSPATAAAPAPVGAAGAAAGAAAVAPPFRPAARPPPPGGRPRRRRRLVRGGGRRRRRRAAARLHAGPPAAWPRGRARRPCPRPRQGHAAGGAVLRGGARRAAGLLGSAGGRAGSREQR